MPIGTLESDSRGLGDNRFAIVISCEPQMLGLRAMNCEYVGDFVVELARRYTPAENRTHADELRPIRARPALRGSAGERVAHASPQLAGYDGDCGDREYHRALREGPHICPSLVVLGA